MNESFIVKEPADTFVPITNFGGAKMTDCGGLLGPCENEIVEVVGEKLQIFVQELPTESLFRNPFLGRKQLSCSVVADTVFKSQLKLGEKSSVFTMFEIEIDWWKGVTFFATAKQDFLSFLDDTNCFSFRSTFGQKAGTKLEDVAFTEIPLSHVLFSGEIVYLGIVKKTCESVPVSLRVIEKLQEKRSSPVGLPVIIAGYPSPVDMEKMLRGYTRDDGTVGWQNATITPEQFKIIISKTLALSNCLLISKGFVRGDEKHMFANMNSGMIGGPVYSFTDSGNIRLVGVNLGYDKEVQLLRFVTF